MKKFFTLDGRVWSASILNVIALALQLRALLWGGDPSTISKGMLLIFIYMQVTFAQAGYRTKMWGQFWGMSVSAVISGTMLVLTFTLR